MDKWSNKFSKVLTAAGISMIVAVSSLAVPIAASAARTVTDDVMIRNDASTDGGIIGSLNEGDEVTILDVTQSADGYAWYYIQLDNGATGYVRSDLIEADDSELADFRDNTEKETPAEEETAEQETSEEETAQEEATAAEQTQSEEEAASAQTETVAADNATGDYDATKDPNANFRAGYEQEADGTVTWYVYNDDNGSKVKISDLQSQSGEQSSSKGPGAWKTLAIVFGIFTVGLAVLLFFLLKSISDDRSKSRRRRVAVEENAADSDDDYEEEEEFLFEDDEDDADEEETQEEPEEHEPENGTDKKNREEKADSTKNSNKSVVNTDSTITMEVPQEAEPTEIPADVIEAAIAAKTAQIEENISKEGKTAGDNSGSAERAREAAQRKENETFAKADDTAQAKESGTKEDAAAQTNENPSASDDSADVHVYTVEKEEYIEVDEDYEDEDYKDEDYEDEDDDDESDASKKSSAKGGFFGFLRKIFHADSKEDIEEGEDFDDYEEEPEEHEFDEFKEYPEDADLLPREDSDDSDYIEEEEEFVEEETGEEPKERGRLSMQRVMKNVSYKEEEADFSHSQEDDQDNYLYDDDDDMEYSFISNRKK